MQEMMDATAKRCYSCIQWDGQRTYYPEKKIIKVDVNKEGTCRITRQKVKGSSHCDEYFPLL